MMLTINQLVHGMVNFGRSFHY